MPPKKKEIIKEKKTNASSTFTKKYSINNGKTKHEAYIYPYRNKMISGPSHSKRAYPYNEKSVALPKYKVVEKRCSLNRRCTGVIIASKPSRLPQKRRRRKLSKLVVNKCPLARGPRCQKVANLRCQKVATVKCPTIRVTNNSLKIAELNKVSKNKNNLLVYHNNVTQAHDVKPREDITSPFTRLTNNNTKSTNLKNHKVMPYQSTYHQVGLSPKEKSYVICKCQAQSTRYLHLKCLATNAMKYNKIFTIYGRCDAVKKALIERGWVQKITPYKMNLSRIRNGTFTTKDDVLSELETLLLSNLVDKSPPNFIWRTKENYYDTTINMNKDNPSIVNRLKVDAMWTSKQGLCISMKRNYWFFIDNVAEVNSPRTYNSYDSGEVEGFTRDYQITACTSLLKWILSMVANDRPIFVETGNIPMNVVEFALNQCKEYLFRKQNKDIDKTLETASPCEWRAFLKKYYNIIAKNEVFMVDSDKKLPLFLGYAQFLLKEIHKYRPQLSCEGCHNIWIIKPAHCSRGRGIRMASKLALITNWLSKSNAKYVVQKYIEEPLLIHETKFDIRQYYLVTSTYPLVMWMYTDCYLKFSSQKYSLKNYHESIHLTNNAVQRKYKNCTERHSELPLYNMWGLDRYRDYLNKSGRTKVWDNVIYPGMKRSIIGIMLSCQDSLSVCKNRFELYGCDFILDKEYKPWLIEINSCPDLNATTPVTAKICPAVCSDIIKVVIDYADDPKSSTGKFECIYRQPMTTPRYGGAADLFVQGYTLPNEYFFRGEIDIIESCDNADLEKERDINYILSNLKSTYHANIMVEPECDSSESIKKEKKVDNRTESEYELSVAASVVNSQLEEIMYKAISEKSDSTQAIPNISLGTLPVDQKDKGIKSLIRRFGNRFGSTTSFLDENSFKFSALDDGPYGKASLYDCCVTNKHSLKHLSNTLESINAKHIHAKNLHELQQTKEYANIITSKKIYNNKLKPTSKYMACERKNSDTNIIQATTRIISFINEKEREYSKSIKP